MSDEPEVRPEGAALMDERGNVLARLDALLRKHRTQPGEQADIPTLTEVVGAPAVAGPAAADIPTLTEVFAQAPEGAPVPRPAPALGAADLDSLVRSRLAEMDEIIDRAVETRLRPRMRELLESELERLVADVKSELKFMARETLADMPRPGAGGD